MKEDKKIYNAKILLFGEYSVIFNSMALSIPYTYFTGKFSFPGRKNYTNYDVAVKSNEGLCALFAFLKAKQSEPEFPKFDMDLFQEDLEKGLFFESNIPQGYGVGSSGAVVAAVYEKYCSEVIVAESTEAILRLKSIFSSIESFFHGTSSGMDPLNCMIGEPLLFESREKVKKVRIPHTRNNAEGAVFLVNTGQPGATEPLVNLFMEKSREAEFNKMIRDSLIPLTNNCILSLKQGDLLAFFSYLQELSALQLEYFREMIPNPFLPLWETGLENRDYLLKLCGSGGGGFLLGFTKDYTVAERLMKEKGIEIMPVFKNSHFTRK